MKLENPRSLLPRLFIALLGIHFAGVLAGCGEPTGSRTSRTSRIEMLSEPVFERAGAQHPSKDWANSILDSADAAYAAHQGATVKSETRVGPQPWPEDLPAPWPILSDAVLVADTKQRAGDRLLLVDLPGSPDQAMDTYQAALLACGYAVDRPRMRQDRRALHALGADHEAVLTFFGRERVSRIEILLLARATG